MWPLNILKRLDNVISACRLYCMPHHEETEPFCVWKAQRHVFCDMFHMSHVVKKPAFCIYVKNKLYSAG